MLWHDEKIDKVGRFIDKIEDSHFIKNDFKPDKKYCLKLSRKHAKENLWIEIMSQNILTNR